MDWYTIVHSKWIVVQMQMPGEFECPDRICMSKNGLAYVSDIDNDCIQVFQQDGQFFRSLVKKC